MKYYIIAGEASGDLHGSNLMKELFARDAEAKIRFWGGQMMNETSLQNGGDYRDFVKDYKEGAVMGFKDVILKAGSILRNLKMCKEDLSSWQPDAVILIDYPGFNLKIAEYAHRKGFKVFWYIAPKVWASREGRIKKIRENIDMLYIVFPFEKKYFDSKHVPYTYCGNPLADSMKDVMRTAPPAEANGKPYIAMLAGSRKSEVQSMMPVFMEIADKLSSMQKFRDYRFIVAGAPSRSLKDYSAWTGEGSKLQVVFGQTQRIIRHAEAAVVNSGTASLETVIADTPQVVVYSTSALNYAIGKRIIKVKYISLGNLIADRLVFKELIQKDFNSENVVEEVVRLTSDKRYVQDMKEGYEEIRTLLGNSGTSGRIAESMVRALADNQACSSAPTSSR